MIYALSRLVKNTNQRQKIYGCGSACFMWNTIPRLRASGLLTFSDKSERTHIPRRGDYFTYSILILLSITSKVSDGDNRINSTIPLILGRLILSTPVLIVLNSKRILLPLISILVNSIQ